MIYLASPYSSPDPAVEQERYEQTQAFVALHLANQIILFSPIVFTHPLTVKYDLPKDAAFWWKFNKRMIEIAKELWVLKLPGWLGSVGVGTEIELFKIIGRPISYKDPLNGPHLSDR